MCVEKAGHRSGQFGERGWLLEMGRVYVLFFE
jgi:hypothetical protein